MTDIKIYQTFHKQYPQSGDCPWLLPIGVGGYRPPSGLSDTDGDSISDLNPYYCELTAQYWVWKNRRHDYVGFYHYRRYLNFLIDSSWISSPITTVAASDATISYLTSEQQYDRLGRLLNLSPIITPKAVITLPSIQDQYINSIERRPWDSMMNKLAARSISDGLSMEYFKEASETPLCNMYVMKWELFDKYCNDLFPLLETISGEIRYGYDAYNNRYPGFLAERFLGYWIRKEHISTMTTPTILLN